MRRTFRIDVETCPDCGGRMKLIALVKDPTSITRFLRHLGLPTEPPARAPPREEPFWQSTVLRRKAANGQLDAGVVEVCASARRKLDVVLARAPEHLYR